MSYEAALQSAGHRAGGEDALAALRWGWARPTASATTLPADGGQAAVTTSAEPSSQMIPSGVCGDEARARRAASAWMRAHAADRGILEQVRMVTLGEDLLTCYERTGLALRAKRYSDGRISFYAAPPDGAGSPLTAREHEVAVLGGGLRSAEIAARQFVSVRTVDAHLRAAYAKTGTGTRVRLANWLRADIMSARGLRGL